MNDKLSRRDLLRWGALASAGAALASCAPQVIKETVEVPVEVEVTREVEVQVRETQIVKETEVVEVTVVGPTVAPVTLSLMMVDYSEDTQIALDNEILPALIDADPGIAGVTVNYSNWGRYNEEMTTAFASGVTPDVFQGGAVWAPQMAVRGWALPLDDFIATATDWDWGDFFPSLQNDVTIDGKVVAVPYRIDLRSFWYRKDHLSEAGFDEPPTNWEELEEMAIACTMREGNQITREGFHYSDPLATNWQNDLQPYLYFMEMAGGTFLSEDLSRCTLADPPAVEALEFIRKLIVEDKVQPYPGFEAQGDLDVLTAGQCSMMMGGGTIERNALLYAPDQLEYLIVTLPLKHKVQATHVWVNKFFISSLTANPAMSWVLLEHLTSKSMSEVYCASNAQTPPRRSLGDADFMTDRMRILLQCTEYAHPYPKHHRLIELFRPLATNLERCFREELAPQEAMNETCAAIDDILAEG
jgi:multiple sugar transport system substrate-binding protein